MTESEAKKLLFRMTYLLYEKEGEPQDELALRVKDCLRRHPEVEDEIKKPITFNDVLLYVFLTLVGAVIIFIIYKIAPYVGAVLSFVWGIISVIFKVLWAIITFLWDIIWGIISFIFDLIF